MTCTSNDIALSAYRLAAQTQTDAHTVKGTIREFMAAAEDPADCVNCLDIPTMTNSSVPWIIQ